MNDVTTYFDQIDWEKLPNAFVIKCNHGCKWQYIIKDKEQYLNTPQLVEITKSQMTGWLEQEYFPWNGFEMQYKWIEPKILIEPLLRDEIDKNTEEIQFYCFNGVPKDIIKFFNESEIVTYNENLEVVNNKFLSERQLNIPADENIKDAYMLSKELSKNFNFVRVDWMLYKNKLYFEELTFTPFSGFIKFNDKSKNYEYGKLIDL